MRNSKLAGLLKPNPTQATKEPIQVAPDSADPEEDEFLTDEQVVKLLKVDKQWLADHRTRVEPIIPHIPMGREIRYPKRELFAFMRSLIETRPSWERKQHTA